MRHSPVEVFAVFLRLGLTSFGGPIAHLSYFRDELVGRRRWLDDAEYADLVALCQVLPGPSSSQVGFALGLRRAGWGGALAAFLGFTLPSAAIMLAVASGAALLAGPIGAGVLSGLQIVTVAVVAHAVWSMARTLTPDRRRVGIALVATLIALLPTGGTGQLIALLGGAAAGLLFCRDEPGTAASALAAPPALPVGRVAGAVCLGLFAAVLIAPAVLAAATGSGAAALFGAFSRAGALVFGGGHVVLPLLDGALVPQGWVSAEQLVAGYGATQAVPGPLFTIAAYLGAVADVGPGGAAGAVIALVAIFLPGFLLLSGVLPFWNALRTRPSTAPALRGANAAVVGILLAALYTPVFTTAVVSPASFALASTCFVLLAVFRLPAWAVVIVGAGGGMVLALTPL